MIIGNGDFKVIGIKGPESLPIKGSKLHITPWKWNKPHTFGLIFIKKAIVSTSVYQP